MPSFRGRGHGAIGAVFVFVLLYTAVLLLRTNSTILQFWRQSESIAPKDESPGVLPEPLEVIDWIRPSSLEIEQIKASNKKSCKNPFQHCCLGQGRQEQYRIDENDSFWKPVFQNDTQRDLHSFLDAIDYFGATQNRGNDKPCTVIFYGDSLSMDHVMGAVCSLLEDGFELKSCNPLLGGQSYGADSNVKCAENIHPDKSHFLLENKDHPTCSQVLIAVPSHCCSAGHRLETFQSWFDSDDWGGLVIFNWGVHCNSKHDIETCMSETLGPVLELAKDDAVTQRWTFIYRETEPQHFNTPGGVWDVELAKKNQTLFRQCSQFQGRADNFRNEFAVQLFEQHNLSLATIPIFSALESFTKLHYDGEDCTHYIYNPIRLQITWEGLYNVLTTIHNNS